MSLIFTALVVAAILYMMDSGNGGNRPRFS